MANTSRLMVLVQDATYDPITDARVTIRAVDREQEDLRVVREPIRFEDGRFAAPTPHSLDT